MKVTQVLRAPLSLSRGIGGHGGSPRKSGGVIGGTCATVSRNVSSMRRGDAIVGAAVALLRTPPTKASAV